VDPRALAISRGRPPPAGALEPWIATIVRNEAARLARFSASISSSTRSLDDVPDPMGSADGLAEAELGMDIYGYVARLDHREGTVVSLWLHGDDTSRIADALHLSQRCTQRIVQRHRTRLQRHIGTP
jgi:DNA-directed RNA polymerase specialized sigma24 family protein